MTTQLPYVGYFATTEVLLYPERFDFRSLRIVPIKLDGGLSIPTDNEATADYYSVMVDEQPPKESLTEKCLGDFANKFDAEIFRDRMAQILDTGAEITTTAMCLWEVLLQIRSNNPRDAIEKAMNAVYTRHGTCEMRNVMAEFAEDCDREHHQAAVAKSFDGSFDWEWCPTWLRTRLTWDPTGEALPTLIAVP